MTDPRTLASLAGAAVAGALLGLLFFGGLLWTVRRLPTARHPALLLLVSYALRLTLAGAGFVVVMGGQWPRAVACLAGFVAARAALIRRERPGPREEVSA